MPLRIKQHRTFKAPVFVSLDVDGEKVSGTVNAEYKMPTIQQREAEMDGIADLLELIREGKALTTNLDGSPKTELSADEIDRSKQIAAEVKKMTKQQSGVLEARLAGVEGLELEDDYGELLEGQHLLSAICNDIELAKSFIAGYGDAMEKKMKAPPETAQKSATSEASSDCSSQEALTAPDETS